MISNAKVNIEELYVYETAVSSVLKINLRAVAFTMSLGFRFIFIFWSYFHLVNGQSLPGLQSTCVACPLRLLEYYVRFAGYNEEVCKGKYFQMFNGH